MLDFSEKVSEWGARILAWIGSIAIIFMMLHTVAEAALRYMFAITIPGTEEIISGYYMVAVVFLPLALVQLERGHIMIELFTMWASPRVKALIDGLVYVACSGALAMMTYAAAGKAIEMTHKNEIWTGLIDVTIWPARWLYPLGTVVMMLVMIVQAAREFQWAITGRPYRDVEPIEQSETL